MAGERKTSLTIDEAHRRKIEGALQGIQLDLGVARFYVEEERENQERDRKVADAMETLEISRLIGFSL